MKFYRQLNQVKALTFDLDDTFYDNHPIIKVAEQQLFSFLIEHWPQLAGTGRELWRQCRRDCISQNALLAHDMIALRRCVLQRLFCHIGLQGAELKEAVERSYQVFYQHRSAFKVSERYVSLLHALGEKVPLIAITNGNVDIERVGLAGCFYRVYHASLQQRSKPFPDMFDAARKALALPASSILHVGDNLQKDVFGALSAGYMAGWYAENRPMIINSEAVQQLPHLQLDDLEELLSLL